MSSIPDVLPAGRFELRLVTPEDTEAINAVESSVDDFDATFHYFTDKPIPVAEYLASDPSRRMYALWSDNEVIGSTSVYNATKDSVTFGFTWISEKARGTGANRAMKQALFDAVRNAGYRYVWFRADVDNEISRHSMEANGAVFSHIEDVPREYPDGRVSRSAFYRREL